MNRTEKYIIKVIEDEYQDYPDLVEFKNRLVRMYLKEYKHISNLKKHFNVETENEIIDLVFKHLKEIWEQVFIDCNVNNLKE